MPPPQPPVMGIAQSLFIFKSAFPLLTLIPTSLDLLTEIVVVQNIFLL